MELIKYLPKEIEYLLDEPMSRHTTFRTGGNADIILLPSSVSELKEIIAVLKKLGVEPIVIGNGSNLLVSDKGIRGVVIKIADNMSKLCIEGTSAKCEAGLHLVKFCASMVDKSLSGAENLFGIPGTVGGAVFMNAGAYGSEIKDILVKAVYITSNGEINELLGTDGYGYRNSPFMGTGNIIVSAEFELSNGNKDDILAKMSDIKSRRVEKQPLNFPSAGSTFKRPDGYFAGALIEQSGLKGRRVGGACVSEKHSGFIVNDNRATTSDILKLIDIIREKVFADHGVMLETEVRFLGER